MRRLAVTALCGPFVCALMACQQQHDLSQADKDAIKGTIDRYVQTAIAASTSHAATDWDKWGETLSADMYYSPPNVPAMHGRPAVLAWVKSFPTITSLVPTIDEISGRGDLAYVRGTYVLNVKLADGSPATDHGSFIEIHRRQADGSWPYTHLEYHSTDPLPAAAPATK